MNNLNRIGRDALVTIVDELGLDPKHQLGDRFYRYPEQFTLFCQYSEWCLSDPQHGALRHVTKSDQLRIEIENLVQLCKTQNADANAWGELAKPIMEIAMSDAGGNEARAADVAYGIAKTVADDDDRKAGAAIRKMLRLTDAKTLHDKLVELMG